MDAVEAFRRIMRMVETRLVRDAKLARETSDDTIALLVAAVEIRTHSGCRDPEDMIWNACPEESKRLDTLAKDFLT